MGRAAHASKGQASNRQQPQQAAGRRQEAGSPAPARTVVAAVLHCEADPGAAQAQQEPCQDGWVGGIDGIGGSRIAEDDGSGALAAGAVGSLGLSALEHLVTHALPAGREDAPSADGRQGIS